MPIRSDETTDPSLLRRIGDWGDHASWAEFTGRYDGLVRRVCRAYRFDAEATDELCQRVWIELARRMRTYRYDPGRRFRGWLRRLCQSRAVDLWRQRQADPLRAVGDALPDLVAPAEPDEPETGDRPRLLREAERVQEAVKGRVGERAWSVFWGIAVEGEPIPEAASRLGMSYAAAFAAQKRVRRMLREEGERLRHDPR